jgi:diguanylate cyclase (GGDEF)-like protein/PAS domain S-box-containing protein
LLHRLGGVRYQCEYALTYFRSAAVGTSLIVPGAPDRTTTDKLAVAIAAGDLAPLERLFLDAQARPPRLVWQPDPADLRTPVLQRLLAAWQAIRPALGQPPPPSEAPGLALGADSDWTMLLEPARPGPAASKSGDLGRLVYTHYGAGIARHYGRSMTGMTMTAFPGHIGRFFSAVYAAVQNRPEPVFTEHEPPATVLVRSWERLILPFAEPGRPVSHFVVGNVPENAVGTLLDVMYDAALVTDGGGRIRLANRAAEKLLGGDVAPLLGSAVDEHLPGLTAVMRRLAEVDDVGAFGRHELTLDRGMPRIDLEVSIGGTRLGGERLFVLVLRDLTERAQRERALQQIAFKDDLTGILNRRGLHQQTDLRRPAGRRSSDGFGLLIVDIDGFKALNDSKGHAAGDQVLRTVAGRLAGSLRGDDAVARWGGDEFVVLLHGIAHPDDLATAAAKLLDALRRPHRIDDHTLDVKVSIGGALQPVHGGDFDSVLAAADKALYRAKSAGGDRLELYADT